MANDNEITQDDIEKEKRRLKKLMPAEKRIEEEKALQRAKELEKKHVPTGREELEEFEEFAEESEHARKLLKPLDSKLKKNKRKK
ncbi:hypothetical protein JW707_00220 [Candidatus Woesearchaeota archaeon]|nr:hypothetical protein [Candidatus Woesearchaeota archaeon]